MTELGAWTMLQFVLKTIISKKWNTAIYADKNLKEFLKNISRTNIKHSGYRFFTNLIFDFNFKTQTPISNKKTFHFEDLQNSCSVVTDDEVKYPQNLQFNI
jgi:hypothetical protein